jgi:hypothetical protein
MHKSATKCNETLGKWCKNKHGASKIMDTLETYQAPGAISHPSWVLEQRLLSPKLRLRWRRCCRTFHGCTLIDLGFSRRRDFIGGRAMLEGGPGAHTTWWRSQGVACATLWCGQPLAPLRLCFGLHLCVRKNRTFGFRFVQFREYFPCNFSETQK